MNGMRLMLFIFSGDAYVDHPSFGPAVIGRVIEDEGISSGNCTTTKLAG